MKYYSISCTSHVVICTIFVIIVVPGHVSSVGYDYEDEDIASKVEDEQRSWCYIMASCREDSSSSDWQKGTCKSGSRQSPIDIQTGNLAPLQRRKKRRVTLRRHKPKGRGFGKNGVPLSPMFSPPLHPAVSSEEGVSRNTDFAEAGGAYRRRQTPPITGGLPIPGFGGPQQGNIPSTVEQGLLCSPQPHWNIIWVNGKPYRYWIQMHLCRLILRQKARFIMAPARKRKRKTPENNTTEETTTTTEQPSTETPTTSSTTTAGPTTITTTATTTTQPTTLPSKSTTTSTTISTTTSSTISTTISSTISTTTSSTTLNPGTTLSTTGTTSSSPGTTTATPKPIPGEPPDKLDFSNAKENYVMKEFSLWNNGRTIQMNNFVPETGVAPTFAWPDQNDAVYKLDQVHFHWGPQDNLGSEHTLDGKAYSAEMHLVHFRSTEGNQGFPDLKSAIESGMGNAVAVIAVFLQVDDSVTTSFLQPHIYNFAKVPRTGDRMTVLCTDARLRLDEVLERATQAFTYMGSFTIPKSCSEVVAWIVCKEPIPIARKDLQMLRSSVREGEYPLYMNYRSVQKSNKQPVSLIGIKQKSAG